MKKSESVDSLTRLNIASKKNLNNTRVLQFQAHELQMQHTRLKKVNSISSNSVSSLGQSSGTSSVMSNEGAGAAKNYDQSKYQSSLLNSQVSFTKEIKSLLEIAENRAKMLCKVYDSNNDEYEAQQLKLFQSKLKPSRNKGELLPAKPGDYKSIICLNYMNSNKKNSNVINKVKLWDQLFHSGHVSGEKWNKEFT